MKKIVALAIGVSLLSGCSAGVKLGLLHDKSEDYLQAQPYPALYVPPPFEKIDSQALYQIPPAAQVEVTQQPDIRPPDLRT